ncbi:FPR2, partial [Fragariocoptes setiger]
MYRNLLVHTLILIVLLLFYSCSTSIFRVVADEDTTREYSNEILNSMPKMPVTEEPTPKPQGQLQIGIKRRPEYCARKAQKGDSLHMHYTGSLKDNGVVFDSSYKRGQPLKFTLGMSQVIKGWDLGLLGTCAGEKRKLVIPPHLAYGEIGSPPNIPPNAALVFEVETIKIDQNHVEL